MPLRLPTLRNFTGPSNIKETAGSLYGDGHSMHATTRHRLEVIFNFHQIPCLAKRWAIERRCEPSLAADHNQLRTIPASVSAGMITPPKIQVTSFRPHGKLPQAAK